jgi:xanthine dehydrogenase small subunit
MSKTLVSPLKSVPLQPSPLRLWHRGQVMNLGNVPPDRTLLELLREDLRLTATKEGCGAGDCGACTVVVAEPVEGRLQYRAVNSCIKPAHAIDGLALWTAADLVEPSGALHPVQQAMVECHGSQCGFCTPGFVMSLFALYQRSVAQGQGVDTHSAHQALSGNLCRCTGYRPIVQAACQLQAQPVQTVDEAPILAALQALAASDTHSASSNANYQRPATLPALLQARTRHPQAQLMAGATDAGLWLTQGLRRMPQIIDLTRVAELRRIEHYPNHIAIGAAVNLQDAFEALATERPVIAPFGERFAGWPVRQSGTLGGNVANGSPIGDSMPLLIALGAQVVLMAWRQGRAVHRHVPLEKFYIGYRKNLLAADEVLAWIVVPKPAHSEWLGAYKVSKRQEDDISAVCLAIQLQLTDGRITAARIGLGGVAAAPARAVQTEAALVGQPWNEATLKKAQAVLQQEFSPLSDLRASADYRRRILVQLLRRAWLESTGQSTVRLEELA